MSKSNHSTDNYYSSSHLEMHKKLNIFREAQNKVWATWLLPAATNVKRRGWSRKQAGQAPNPFAIWCCCTYTRITKPQADRSSLCSVRGFPIRYSMDLGVPRTRRRRPIDWPTCLIEGKTKGHHRHLDRYQGCWRQVSASISWLQSSWYFGSF